MSMLNADMMMMMMIITIVIIINNKVLTLSDTL